MSDDEPFVIAFQSLETSELINNDLYEKLVASLKSPTTFDVTWVPFFIPDFNWLSCKLVNVTFKVLYFVILDQNSIEGK